MKNVLGGIMLGCGILIAGLTGLCLLLSAVTFLPDANPTPLNEVIGLIPTLLAGFGVPFAIGIGLIFGGRALMNAANPARTQTPVPPEQVKPAVPAEAPRSGPE